MFSSNWLSAIVAGAILVIVIIAVAMWLRSHRGQIHNESHPYRFFEGNGGIKLIFLTVLVVAVGYYGIRWYESASTVTSWSWAKFWLYLGVAYILVSFVQGFVNPVRENELAVRVIVGIPIDSISSGPPFLPLGISSVIRLPLNVQQIELPTEPERVYRGEMKGEDIPLGHKPPTRITFSSGISDDDAKKVFGDDYSVSLGGTTHTFNASAPKDGLSNRRVTAEVVQVVRWRIHDGVAFIQTVGTVEEANRQLEDAAVSLASRILTQMSVGQALLNLGWINALLFIELQKRISFVREKSASWGIDLENAQLKVILFHHDLNIAIGGASEAAFEAQQTVTTSEAEKTKRINEGAGTASAARALEEETLTGRGAGLKAIADLLGITPEEAARLDVARALGTGDGTFVFGADGIGQLATIAKALQSKEKPKEGSTT